MKKLVFAVFASLSVGVVAFAEEKPAAPAPDGKMKVRHMTPEMREKMKQRTGGIVVKSGSQRGKIAFINTQDKVAEDVVKAVPVNYGQLTGFNMVYEKAAAGDVVALKEASNADIAVVAVWDEKSPSVLIALDDGWAVVNFAKLDRNLKTQEAKEKFFTGRCQKELLRAFTTLAGGAASSFEGDNIMNATKVEELDLCKVFIPNDKIQIFKRELPKRGVTPLIKAHYRQACMQGWAPAPTNDYQKAIWDKVHQLPTKPIKVEFDPKKGE